MAIQRLLYFKASRLRSWTRTVARYTSDCYSDINHEEDSSTSHDATKYYPACIGAYSRQIPPDIETRMGRQFYCVAG